MLNPSRHIVPPDWMTDYKSLKIMRVLGGDQPEPQALFVGGCVRNTLFGVPVKDIDIATVHPPLEVIERLKAAGIRFVPTGLDHGTVTAIIDDGTFEITTLRRDIETDGRFAVIAFSTEWEEDAQRRDFTVNTLLATMDGTIYDPVGTALEDIDHRRIVFVGDAEKRISEDYLRILRFFRFYAQYGQGQPDRVALSACKLYAPKISSLSKERITQEFLKILSVSNPTPILNIMFENGVLGDMAKDYKQNRMQRLCDCQIRYDAPDIMARLFVIAGMKDEGFPDRLVLSNAQKRQIDIFAQGVAVLKTVSRKKIRELVYRLGNDSALQSYFLYIARKDQLPDIEMIETARYWKPPVFSIKAEDLMQAGISQGPALGKTLKDLEEKWIAKDFPADFSFKK